MLHMLALTRPVVVLGALFALVSCEKANPAYRGPVVEITTVAPDAAAPDAAALDVAAPDLAPSPDLALAEDRGANEDATSAEDLTAPDLAPPAALLVVNDLDLEPMDQQARQRLEALGFIVSLKLDSDAVAGDANDMALVVVSGSTHSTRIGGIFRDVPVPVICYDSWMFPLMGLTGPRGDVDFGQDYKRGPRDARLAILGTHPLAAGLSGTITVTDEAIDLSWGRPFEEAALVAALVGDPTRIALFGYLRGARLQGGLPAPARRVGSFAQYPNGHSLTAEGLRLFDAAVLWATAGP
jgi:hypothetical protein